MKRKARMKPVGRRSSRSSARAKAGLALMRTIQRGFWKRRPTANQIWSTTNEPSAAQMHAGTSGTSPRCASTPPVTSTASPSTPAPSRIASRPYFATRGSIVIEEAMPDRPVAFQPKLAAWRWPLTCAILAPGKQGYMMGKIILTGLALAGVGFSAPALAQGAAAPAVAPAWALNVEPARCTLTRGLGPAGDTIMSLTTLAGSYSYRLSISVPEISRREGWLRFAVTIALTAADARFPTPGAGATLSGRRGTLIAYNLKAEFVTALGNATALT